MSGVDTGFRAQIVDAFGGDGSLELSAQEISERIGGTTAAAVRSWCRVSVDKEELDTVVKAGEICKYKLGPSWRTAPKNGGGGGVSAPRNVPAIGASGITGGKTPVGGAPTSAAPPAAKRPEPPIAGGGGAHGRKSIDALLQEAEEEPDHSVGRYVELMPIVDKLRRKELTWKEIEQWLKLRGQDATYSGLMNTYKEWKKTNAGQGLPQ